MSDTKDTRKRKTNSYKKKKKYRSDGSAIWEKRYIEGPGVWVSCVKGKEKQTVGEIYNIFDSVAEEMWPLRNREADDSESDSNDDVSYDIETQISKEMSAMKRPRTESRFASCQTNTPCVVFISCKPPVDPVQLVVRYVENVQATGVTRTRYTHRLVPVSDSCVTNIPEIQSLCRKVFAEFFDRRAGKTFSYKIELRLRNHTTLTRPVLIQNIAQCVPEGHRVALTDPEIFILVEVFKSICGVAIVENYYKLQKYNVMEIVKSGSENAKQITRVE